MANRHKVQARARGGRTVYAGKGSNVEKEAEEKKRGGRAYKDGGRVAGSAPATRLDKRARGGGVGADKHPFSSAHVAGAGNPAGNPPVHRSK